MGFLSSLFGGLGSALSGAGSSIMGGLGKIAQPIMSMFSGGGSGGNLLGSLFGGGGGGSQAPATSGAQNMFSQVGGPNSFMPSTSSVSIPGFSSNSSGKKKSGFLDNLFPGGSAQGIAGLAAPLLGNIFAPKSPSAPNLNSLSSVQALQNFRPGNSVSPEYQDMIQRNTGKLRETKVRELQQLYHNARPGTDYLSDSAYQRDLANLDKGIQDNMADELTQAESTFSQQEQDRLSQLAQMDIYSIMAQTGMEAQEAEQFKEMFSNVGSMFLTNATKKPGFDMNSLFGGN